MRHLIEPVHAVLYYAPELTEEAAALGLPTGERWPSYFAWQSAPLGAAGPELVTATYYSFSPRMVAEYVPAVRSTAEPAKVLAARLAGLDRALRALLGDRVDSPELAEAAVLARRAVRAADPAGRPLAAANADLPWPDAPHLALGRPPPSSASTAATGMWLRCSPPGSTRPRRWFRSQPSAPPRSRSSPAGGGAARSGPPPASGSPPGACSVPTAWPPTPVSGCARRWSGVPTSWPPPPGGRLGPAASRFAQLVAPITQAVVATGLLPTRSTLGIRRTR